MVALVLGNHDVWLVSQASKTFELSYTHAARSAACRHVGSCGGIRRCSCCAEQGTPHTATPAFHADVCSRISGSWLGVLQSELDVRGKGKLAVGRPHTGACCMACDVLPQPVVCQRRARALRSVPAALTKCGHSLRFFCAVKTSVESSLALINTQQHSIYMQWMRCRVGHWALHGHWLSWWWSHAACNRLRGGRGTTDALKFVQCSGMRWPRHN